MEIINPFQFFTEVDGSPLDNGEIYIGDENLDPETNPKAVFWDEALTIPASQPMTTISGSIYNGNSPARAYTSGAYSITARDVRGELVFTNLSVPDDASVDTYQVKVSSDDTTGGHLDGKLLAGSGVTLTVGNPAGNETLTIAVDHKVKVSSNDTTAGYLNGKLVAGAGIAFTEGSDGANETLTVKSAELASFVQATSGNVTIGSTEGIMLNEVALGTGVVGDIWLVDLKTEWDDATVGTRQVEVRNGAGGGQIHAYSASGTAEAEGYLFTAAAVTTGNISVSSLFKVTHAGSITLDVAATSHPGNTVGRAFLQAWKLKAG